MRDIFRDSEHLFRMAGLFVLGIAAFLLLRQVFVPEDFGELGHFRTGAMVDNRQRVPVHAGREVCADCHDDVVAAREVGAHRNVGCEACHGPLGAHAAGELDEAPELPDIIRLCQRCHGQMPSRPAWFPQVDLEDHAGGMDCSDCHTPHDPGV